MGQFILLLLLAGGSHAFFSAPETKCDATQNITSCFPVVGGFVHIKLLTNATNIYKIKCLKDGQGIISLKKNNVYVFDAYKNRTEFQITTGTLKIINVERTDTGQYSVERYDENGKRVNVMSFRLQVQESTQKLLVIACVAGVVVVLIVLCCFVCSKLKKSKKSKGNQGKKTIALHELDC